MSPSPSAALSSSIYSRLCWDCILYGRSAQVGGRRARKNGASTTSYSRATRSRGSQTRAFHHGRIRRQEAAVLASSATPAKLPPEPIQRPIRQHLTEWQKEKGNPLSDFLGLDAPFGVRNLVADTYGDSKQKKPGDLENDNDDEEQLPPSLYDQDLTKYGSKYLEMGDLVELSSSLPNGPPVLCVFARTLQATQAQLITMRGKWVVVNEKAIKFSVPRFIDKRLVEPIIPYLPEGEVIEELLGLTHIFDTSVPREITAPVVTALRNFNADSEEVYRKHALTLDNAHDTLAHETDLRFGTLERITDRLIGKDSGAHRLAAMYAVRKALLTGGMGFGFDQRSHRITGVFQIRPKEQLKYATTALQWLREYQEWEVSRKMSETSEETGAGRPKQTHGVRAIQKFTAKARAAIIESRKHRSAEHLISGAIGPSDKRFPFTSPHGTLRRRKIVEFDDDDRVLIRVLEYAGVQSILTHEGSLQALLPLILRSTGMFDEEPYCIVLDRRAYFTFLIEIGVLTPFEDITHYDVNLLLPSSQHSKPLEQLATTLNSLNRSEVDLKDDFADLRKNLMGRTAFAIDSRGAHEIDDAISVSRIPGTKSKAWLHIHIANPTSHIKRDSVFARMAAHLTETFYSPSRNVPLLPQWLTEEMFSLRSGRPCLTISALVDKQGEILDVKIEHGKLGKLISLEYSQLPGLLNLEKEKTEPMAPMVVGGELPAETPLPQPSLTAEQKADLNLMYKFALARHKYRNRKGGFKSVVSQPEITVHAKPDQFGLPEMFPRRLRGVHVYGDPIIAIQPHKYENPFKTKESGDEILVPELMLLAGECFARWCNLRDIPIPYRTMQTRPGSLSYEEAYKSIIVPAIEKYGEIPVGAGFKFVEQAGNTMMTTTGLPHPALGLDMYSKSTSPLRRYGDMIAHWQVEAALREEARAGHSSLLTTKRHDYLPFTRTHMENIILRLHPRERLIVGSKQRSERHWISHWFFRAHYFNEYPLPKTMKVIILRATELLHVSIAPLTQACWMDTGLIFKMPGQDAQGNILKQGDIWEAEMGFVGPYFPETVLTPLRLLEREEE